MSWNILRKMRENADKNRHLQMLDSIRASYKLKTVLNRETSKYYYVIVHDGHYVRDLEENITINDAMAELRNIAGIDAKLQEI